MVPERNKSRRPAPFHRVLDPLGRTLYRLRDHLSVLSGTFLKRGRNPGNHGGGRSWPPGKERRMILPRRLRQAFFLLLFLLTAFPLAATRDDRQPREVRQSRLG